MRSFRSSLFLVVVLVSIGRLSQAADSAGRLPPQHLGPPLPEHAVTNRAFTGIPSLAVAPDGRLWATWYAGVTPAEDQNNYVVLSTSADGGTTWQEVLTVDPDGAGPVRAFDPELWVSPDGRLFFFWAQMDKSRRDTELGVWCIETSQPDQPTPRWNSPRRLGNGVMMCKPLVLSSGEWVLPISTWREHDHSAQMVVSTDQGKNWKLRGGCNVPKADRQFDEHMFVQRKDGSIWLLCRTNYGIGESLSVDHGKSWPELKPSAIPHTPARFFVRRLASGNLLLVKHGPLDAKTGRSHLTAYLSEDDGKSWKGGLMLDERRGVSYPDGQQTPDGRIRIIYDYNRTRDREILMAVFREQDVQRGQAVTPDVRYRQLVSKSSGGRQESVTRPPPIQANDKGQPLRTDRPGSWSHPAVTPQAFQVGAKLFDDRRYRAAEIPQALQETKFLAVAMDGSKTLTCSRAGTLWLLTPKPERNRDSQSAALEDQGFQVVSLPEVRLFNPESPANYCTLYQKDCRSGESVVIGKWAVPIFLP
jgi:predicted neuraminidase